MKWHSDKAVHDRCNEKLLEISEIMDPLLRFQTAIRHICVLGATLPSKVKFREWSRRMSVIALDPSTFKKI